MNGQTNKALKYLMIGFAITVLVTSAYAGVWPKVGDQFRSKDDSLLIVTKIKKRPDVNESLVCMHRSGTRAQDTSCTWVKVGDLQGDWMIYDGVPQGETK
jgi:hypothetical protein